MFKNLCLSCFLVAAMVSSAFAWTNCPPATLPSNPSPATSGGGSCIIEAKWNQLSLNETWTRDVRLESGQSYWFSASKCARAYSIAGEIRDDQGKVLKSDSGSSIGFCFRAPKTGTYKVAYRVTSLNGSYSYAITDVCLSRSSCSP